MGRVQNSPENLVRSETVEAGCCEESWGSDTNAGWAGRGPREGLTRPFFFYLSLESHKVSGEVSSMCWASAAACSAPRIAT